MFGLGRQESLYHPWQPTRLNGWNHICSLLHSLCSICCTNYAEEPCEPPKRCSTNITSQAIKAGQGSVYVHNHCHKEQSSTQQDKPPSGRALEMLQARPPADRVLLKGPLDKTPCPKLFPTIKFRTVLAVSCLLSQFFRVQSRFTIIFRPCPKFCTPLKPVQGPCTPCWQLISGRINRPLIARIRYAIHSCTSVLSIPCISACKLSKPCTGIRLSKRQVGMNTCHIAEVQDIDKSVIMIRAGCMDADEFTLSLWQNVPAQTWQCTHLQWQSC